MQNNTCKLILIDVIPCFASEDGPRRPKSRRITNKLNKTSKILNKGFINEVKNPKYKRVVE